MRTVAIIYELIYKIHKKLIAKKFKQNVLHKNFQIATFDGNIEQLIMSGLMIIALYYYMFLSNYVAQEITEHNNNIFITV